MHFLLNIYLEYGVCFILAYVVSPSQYIYIETDSCLVLCSMLMTASRKLCEPNNVSRLGTIATFQKIVKVWEFV